MNMTMVKKPLLATAAVFVTWGVLDYILHGVILRSTYTGMVTEKMMRPEADMKMGLIYVVLLIHSFAFVYIYQMLMSDRTQKTALLYGLAVGIMIGVGMGYGTYAMMPIKYNLALTWFLGTVVEAVIGAWVMWYIIGRGAAPAKA
ncbi:MAG: hypothetical protein HY423_00065 [Candidatus Lambdaproteobacteria bacterium]|nr:hypothetical protein [Candidatus Lambdaproteobacteria bacterium]